jgi:hypothetical protein
MHVHLESEQYRRMPAPSEHVPRSSTRPGEIAAPYLRPRDVVVFGGSRDFTNQPLAALASLDPKHTTAQLRHTQSQFDTFSAHARVCDDLPP